MKKILLFAGMMLICIVLASCHHTCRNRERSNTDSIWKQHTLYECVVLKGNETNVDVHVRKGEKPDGMFASGGNFFWVNFADVNAPERAEIPKQLPEITLNQFRPSKIKRSYIVMLKEGETVDYVSRYGFIIRTWDRAIRVHYIYEE